MRVGIAGFGNAGRTDAQARPSVDNPKTSRIVAPSILAALRARAAPIRVGS